MKFGVRKTTMLRSKGRDGDDGGGAVRREHEIW